MILDRQNMLSYKQLLTVTANSTDIIDLGPAMWSGYSGKDKSLPMFLAIDEAFAAAGAATLNIELQSAPVADFSTGVVSHWQSGALPKTRLITTGRMPLSASLPVDVLRYVRAVYTVATGPFTSGRISFGLTADRQANF